MVNHNLYITFLYSACGWNITVLIGAAVPAERNMKTKSSEYVITAPFCVHKQNFLKAAWVYYLHYTDFWRGKNDENIYLYIQGQLHSNIQPNFTVRY